MLFINKKYFGVDKRVRKSRFGFYYLVKTFVPCLALKLPCGFALDILFYNGWSTMDGLQ